MQSSEINVPAAMAYWVQAPGVGCIGHAALGNGVLIESVFSAVSPGTERLVGLGGVPESAYSAMACRAMEGTFKFPLKYGYCSVGRALSGQNAGRHVYTMHPHQDYFRAEESSLVMLPEALEPLRATLIPNTETALNAVWDAELLPGERVLIVGGGIVGSLIAAIASRLPGVEVVLLETNFAQRNLLGRINWTVQVVNEITDAAPFDVSFHASGSSAGLQSAIDNVGFEGRIVELSWYGEKPVTLNLGGAFHYQRKRIMSTQVGNIASGARNRFDFSRRLAVVMKILEDSMFDSFISHNISFLELPRFMQDIYASNLNSLSIAVCYGKG